MIKAIRLTSRITYKSVVVILDGFKLDKRWIGVLQEKTPYRVHNAKHNLDTAESCITVTTTEELVNFVSMHKFYTKKVTFTYNWNPVHAVKIPEYFNLISIKESYPGYYFFRFDLPSYVSIDFPKYWEDKKAPKVYFGIAKNNALYASTDEFRIELNKEIINKPIIIIYKKVSFAHAEEVVCER